MTKIKALMTIFALVATIFTESSVELSNITNSEYTEQPLKKNTVETNQLPTETFSEEIETKEGTMTDQSTEPEERSVVETTKNKVTNKTDKPVSGLSVSKTKRDAGKEVEKHPEKETPSHIHDWEPIYSYETIEDIGHELREICKGCGADITSWSTSKWNEHSDAHLIAGEPAGFYEKEFKVVTGTHEIRKIVGYQCSCGATK